MMPMVFCASLPPWPSEYRPAETSCRRRNQPSMRSGDCRRQIHDTAISVAAPSTNPSNGEMMMKAPAFQMPAPMRCENPPRPMTAPTMPPMRACELLDGMPNHQVNRFHAMAPTSAPKITCTSTNDTSTMPLPTVEATFRWKIQMATMLKKAANSTAVCGLSTPVDHTVAMELAASWKPFMKSNSTASTTSMATRPKPIWIECISGILEDDAFDDVGDVLAAVGDGLQVLVDRLELDQLAGVDLVAEQARHGRAHHAVGVGLEAVDLLAGLQRGLRHLGVLQARQQADHVLHAVAATHRDLAQAHHILADTLHVVQRQHFAGVLQQVDDVVHRV